MVRDVSCRVLRVRVVQHCVKTSALDDRRLRALDSSRISRFGNDSASLELLLMVMSVC